MLIILAAVLVSWSRPAVVSADTTADCGRFHLKTDRKTGKKKCVSGKRKQPGGAVTVQSIRRQQRAAQQLIQRAQRLLSGEDLSADQRRRARELVVEARQRIEKIKRQTNQLRQQQKQFADEVANASKQRSRAQQEMSRALEQQQRDLTQQLLAQQRQLLQSLQRNRQAFQRRN